jgi:hypothetical protein
VAFSAVVSSALSYLGLIIRGKFPGIVDMQPRGHDAFISEYALARVFPNDGEQLLDHLMAVQERNTALPSERPDRSLPPFARQPIRWFWLHKSTMTAARASDRTDLASRSP